MYEYVICSYCDTNKSPHLLCILKFFFFNIWRNIILIDDVEVFKFVGVFSENRNMLFIDRQSVTMSVP